MLLFLDKLSWKTFCTHVYIKQILDQNVHVSISKEIFLVMHKNHNQMLMLNGTLRDNVQLA